ncbi:MAG: hypothetical protein M3R21_09535, partial [Candidatus Dormibacteraeota bacterium]|nr:hypothetical protein [Candidatus Dormibacteraeota bacterium]
MTAARLSEFIGDTQVTFQFRDRVSSPHPVLDEPVAGRWDEGPPLDSEWRDASKNSVFVEPAGDGVLKVQMHVPGAGLVGARFQRHADEVFWGFGVRSDAVQRSGGVVENWVGEGPFQLAEYPAVHAVTPRWAIRQRQDAAYYPVPWILSSRGYGVLIDSPELSRFRLDAAPDWWSVEILSDHLTLRCFLGETPAAALEKFTGATGRQPYPAAPWFLGPWCQTGHANLVPFEVEADILATLRSADAPISAVETHMRRLPGGAHEGRRDAERRRTGLFHTYGLASLTYLNPFVSQDYEKRFEQASPALQRRADGEPYVYPAYIGDRDPPLTIEGQLDYSARGAEELFTELAREVIDDGHDGWMEDFGEYTPTDALCADGTTGALAHNPYPVQYHAAGARAAVAAGSVRPVARFARSGWTGAAPHIPLVWGGDPTTGWGFDGLASAVMQGLSAGLSGIAFWGSDIGGFFSLGEEKLDSELLIRWIQFGALSPLMRTKSGGISNHPAPRPQIWDREILPHWRRWAKFHTQLSPYLLGAAAEYVETGIPLMRHACLTDPSTDVARPSDQYLLGSWLLAAPALQPGARERVVQLPGGQWIDLWRSVSYEPS